MSYSTDSYTQEDTLTFPVYQRLRKINPYAYYSLDAQKQMQQDLREAGSLVFFEQSEDAMPGPDEAVGLISLPDALSEADNMIETGDAHINTPLPTPHVCNIQCTYTRKYPTVPCSPYVTAQCLHRHVTFTHPVISLMNHIGDDIN